MHPILAATLRSDITKGLLSFCLASLLFIVVLQFMPAWWWHLADEADLPKVFYDIMGIGGLTLIGMTVIALKSGIYGARADKHPWFIALNTLGALTHLISFGYYHNPNGITLDVIYSLVGIYGLASLYFTRNNRAFEPLARTPYLAPSVVRLVLVVGVVQLMLLALVWMVWPMVMDVAQRYDEAFFHHAGTFGGIMILTCFLGQMLGLIHANGRMYDVLYSLGIWAYIINLSIEFNPYTVALEFTIFIFLFIRLGKSQPAAPQAS